jgi:hypothetical protein
MVLLDRVPVARQPGPLRSGPIRDAFGGRRPGLGVDRGPPSTPDRPAWGDDDGRGIRGDRVRQLDLDADDGMDAGRLGGGRESDGAVEALVVGDAEPGESQLDRPLGTRSSSGSGARRRPSDHP